MAAHALDRQMGLAGVGGAEHRDQRLGGEARHVRHKMAQAPAKASEPSRSPHVAVRSTKGFTSAEKGVTSSQRTALNPRIG
jgi:hypothetical protein